MTRSRLKATSKERAVADGSPDEHGRPELPAALVCESADGCSVVDEPFANRTIDTNTPTAVRDADRAMPLRQDVRAFFTYSKEWRTPSVGSFSSISYSMFAA